MKIETLLIAVKPRQIVQKLVHAFRLDRISSNMTEYVRPGYAYAEGYSNRLSLL
jgi:hypothetical protein